MRHDRGSPVRRLALSALFTIFAACASAPLATPETVTFAPGTRVDLAAMQRLPSGVHVQDLRAGEGEPARAGQRVALYYVGWLPDGTQFDALVPPHVPLEFRLGDRQVIRGWEEGVVGMRVGGQRMLVVPAELGYGRRRTDTVPPNSVLVFVVELVRAF